MKQNRIRSALRVSITPRSHWNKHHGRKRTAKHPYNSMQEARTYIEHNGLQNTYTAYRCHVCGLYHIGHFKK